MNEARQVPRVYTNIRVASCVVSDFLENAQDEIFEKNQGTHPD